MAEAFIDFAASDMRPWLCTLGMRWFPIVGWAERGGAHAHGHGNSVPRFHITWGTGPGVVKPFVDRFMRRVDEGLAEVHFRHRVTELKRAGGQVAGVSGQVLEPSTVGRGEKSGQRVIGEFDLDCECVIVTSGGIGGNHDLVRKNWPVEQLGPAPEHMVAGVPHHVDGRMIGVAQAAGAAVINADRMWHYTEGLQNWSPIWPNHGIRVLPGPSSMWFDALGERMEAPCMPGFDTRSTLKRILSTGHEHSWFILNREIIRKEFSLSGSEQNPDLTGAKWRLVLKNRRGGRVPPPVQAFMDRGKDFVVAETLEQLVDGMNRIAGKARLDVASLRRQIEARDLEIDNPYSKDAQVTAIQGARRYIGDKLIRTAKPHRLLDPKKGPLIAVRLNILTRKTLGGLHTDLDSRVLDHDGQPISGLYAAGECAGFGGGGYHGYNALEGTFLGGCLFSGRRAGRHAAGR